MTERRAARGSNSTFAAARGWWLALGVALAACASAPSTHPEASSNAASGPAVRWSVSQGLWGTEVFEVGQDGRGHYSFQPVGEGVGKEYDVTVSTSELDAIASAAESKGFCRERSSRLGIPDEGKPSLRVRRGAVDCEVTLWDGEWRERSGPNEIAGMVVALRKGHD